MRLNPHHRLGGDFFLRRRKRVRKILVFVLREIIYLIVLINWLSMNNQIDTFYFVKDGFSPYD